MTPTGVFTKNPSSVVIHNHTPTPLPKDLSSISEPTLSPYLELPHTYGELMKNLSFKVDAMAARFDAYQTESKDTLALLEDKVDAMAARLDIYQTESKDTLALLDDKVEAMAAKLDAYQTESKKTLTLLEDKVEAMVVAQGETTIRITRLERGFNSLETDFSRTNTELKILAWNVTQLDHRLSENVSKSGASIMQSSSSPETDMAFRIVSAKE